MCATCGASYYWLDSFGVDAPELDKYTFGRVVNLFGVFRVVVTKDKKTGFQKNLPEVKRP